MSRADIFRKAFYRCPHCGKSEHGIQHLIDALYDTRAEKSFGPWHCEECRHEFSGVVRFLPGVIGDTPVVEITRCEPWKKVPKLSLLRIRDLYLVVDSYGDYQPEEQNRLWYDYLFHSHQCPTSIMRSAMEVFDKDGRDPHGILRFVAALDDNEENRQKLDEAGTQEDLFKLFQTDGKDAPSSWPEVNKGVIPWIAEMQRGEGVPLSSFSVKISSSEEDIKQGILKAEIISTPHPDEVKKQVIEYMTRALENLLGRTPK